MEEQAQETPTPPAGNNRWLIAAAIVFFVATVACGFYIVQQKHQNAKLEAGYDQMSMALNRTRTQLDMVTAKLNSLSAPPPAQATPPVAKPAAPKRRHVAVKNTRVKRPRTEDPRWKQMQAELAEHEKQIAEARRDLENTRSDLEGKLGSTRDELNGSIARTHGELVALQRRGERNYFEFDLAKSKLFNRTGPISISLRKTNARHQFCNLKLIVDDMEVEKKHVNLYEPVLFYPADYAQPLELVINQISKNLVHGYVSVPKFRQSQLAAGAPAATAAAQPSAPATASLEHRAATMPQ